VNRSVALVIDEAQGVLEHPVDAVIDPTRVVPGAGQFRGVVKLDDGLVLIHDLESCLSLDEERALGDAMDREAAHGS
jgi:purine-binding chemotaxis protein CheW